MPNHSRFLFPHFFFVLLCLGGAILIQHPAAWITETVASKSLDEASKLMKYAEGKERFATQMAADPAAKGFGGEQKKVDKAVFVAWIAQQNPSAGADRAQDLGRVDTNGKISILSA